MIQTQDRRGWIGGSDAIRLYSDFTSKTFVEWWDERKTGKRGFSLDNQHTKAGNILEGFILEHLKIPRENWSIKVSLEGTMAGVNTDALDEHVHDAKTALPEIVLKYILGGKITKAYTAQLLHGMVCTGRKSSKLHVLMVTEAEKRWPFEMIDKIPERLHTFTFPIEYFNEPDFNPENHLLRIKYLSHCFERGARPNNEILNKFITKFTIKSLTNVRNNKSSIEAKNTRPIEHEASKYPLLNI